MNPDFEFAIEAVREFREDPDREVFRIGYTRGSFLYDFVGTPREVFQELGKKFPEKQNGMFQIPINPLNMEFLEAFFRTLEIWHDEKQKMAPRG